METAIPEQVIPARVQVDVDGTQMATLLKRHGATKVGTLTEGQQTVENHVTTILEIVDLHRSRPPAPGPKLALKSGK